ncbi:MMPL family transporter [soil metagenome]
MLAAWGRFVFRRRGPLLGLCVVFLAFVGWALSRGGHLTTGTIQGIEAEDAQLMVEAARGDQGGPNFVAMYSSKTMTVDDPAFYEEMGKSLEPLATDPHVAVVLSPVEAPGPIGAKLLSRDKTRAIAIVVLKGDLSDASHDYPAVRAKMKTTTLDLSCTGSLSYRHDLDTTLKSDLFLAELVSLPLALFVLLFVFRSVVAALLPVGIGALSVLGGIAVIMVMSHYTDMPQYTLNMASLIGLGVAIDYSLFYVSRFREELHKGVTVEQATVATMETAGHSIAFSGVAVVVGLTGLLFFPHSYLSAMGIAGALVVVFALLFALTFLPALVAILGKKVDALSIRKHQNPTDGEDRDFWRRLAPRVMRHPLLILIPTLIFLVTLGTPFLRLRMAALHVSVLPMKTESRATYELLRTEFESQGKNRIDVVVKFPDDTMTEDRARALFVERDRLRALPGVDDVESVLDFDPTLDRDLAVKLLALPEDQRPIDVATAMQLTGGKGLTVLSVISPLGARTDPARDLVKEIRKKRDIADGRLLVTGPSANDLDSMVFILGHTPQAIAFVMILTYAILFFLLRSVILPLKAVLMNLLSISGCFGALVFIFQDGHFASVLRFEPGPVEPTLPVLLFCVVFGLSMDYEVLMMSRMKEEFEKHGDNERAVTEGLAQSGRLITSAAAIMVAVFAAFALASVVVVKAMGVGMAIAVTLDATLVRLLIVPATMHFFGRWNWWPGEKKKKPAAS